MNKKFTFRKAMVAILVPLCAVGMQLSAQINPLDLDQAGDAFGTVGLPILGDINSLAGTFAEGVVYTNPAVGPAWTPIDPALAGVSAVGTMNVWSVGGIADFGNQVGYNVNGDFSLGAGDKAILFSDASPAGTPPDSQVVNPAAFVSLINSVGPGQLDFFLVADAQTGGVKDLYWTDLAPGGTVTSGQTADVNPDGMQHALAFLHSSGNYIMYAWEDLPNLGDMDFNDVFVLISHDHLIVIPEPGTYLMLGTMLCFVLYMKRRREVAAAA